MVIGDLLEEAALKLENEGIGDSYNEALILFTYALECNRTYIYVHRDKEVPDENKDLFRNYIERRSKGEPTAYIVRKAWFMNLEFNVNSSVLIPRPETEGAVETVLKLIGERKIEKPRILDMCTGSGCIGISIADAVKGALVDLVDIDCSALAVASENIEKHFLGNRVFAVQSNLFDELNGEIYDIIVSNPPYVRKGDTKHLSEEVRKYEPHIALYAGEDGLSFYRKIAKAAHSHMKKGSYLVLEAGIGQADNISSLLKAYGYLIVSIENDINGIPRIITAKSEKSQSNL